MKNKPFEKFINPRDSKKPKSENKTVGFKKVEHKESEQKSYPRPVPHAIISHKSLFSMKSLPRPEREILNDFQSVIQNVRPLSARQLLTLPREIRDLSHSLTDTRGERRVGYMNEKVQLSAYTRYFMWWNLIRLTRLFANIDFSALGLKDGDVCLDLGSGPLTAVIALWISRPELRNLKLTWYCMDISQGALAFGEELYLTVAGRVPGEKLEKREGVKSESVDTDEGVEYAENVESELFSHWKIIRVKGTIGTSLKQKAKFIVCANMLNEAYQNADRPPDFLAKKYTDGISSYLDSDAKEGTGILVIEPGVPKAARFLSLMRDCFIRRGLTVLSPCPHEKECPMDGRNIHKKTDSGSGKWCNFAFSTEEAPSKLLKLSAMAGIPKERAVLSFVFGVKSNCAKDEKMLSLRVASDVIHLPGDRIGYYACSELGLTLVIVQSKIDVTSGDLITIRKPENIAALQHDRKTGATIIVI